MLIFPTQAEGETSGLPFGGQDWERVNLNWQAGKNATMELGVFLKPLQ